MFRLVGYYRKYIKGFASITVPFLDLTEKPFPNKVNWGISHHKKFVTFKDALNEPPLVKLPYVDKELILQTDASDMSLPLYYCSYVIIIGLSYTSSKLKTL